jgi:hypothetical protein
VIIVDFEDEQVGCSPSNISETIWGTTSTAYQYENGPWENVYRTFQENSFNRVQYVRNSTFDPVKDVVGPYRLNRRMKDERTCNYNTWSDEALMMALDDGVPVSHYNQLSFILPDSDRLHSILCRWTGLAHVGCGYLCRSWISDCKSLGVFSHELGHNAGFAHAGSHWEMKGDAIEYGDPTAIMSNQWSSKEWKKKDFYFGAIFRAHLNWLPSSSIMSLSAFSPPPNDVGRFTTEHQYLLASPSVLGQKLAKYRPFHHDSSYFSSMTARIFQISPYHLPASRNDIPRALKIERTMYGNFFWISYHIGNVAYPQHALVHLQQYAGSTQTSIIQTIIPYYLETENVTTSTETTLFRDFDQTFSLRVLRASDEVMDIQMTWICEQRTPLIELSSGIIPHFGTEHLEDVDLVKLFVTSTSQPLFFSLDVTNMDSDMCRPTEYIFDYFLPDGINMTCTATNSLKISPGTTCQLSCKIIFISGVVSSPITIKLLGRENLDNGTVVLRTVTVEMMTQTCKKISPRLKLLSGPLALSVNGLSASVLLELTNMDHSASASCAARSWTILTQVDEGWTAVLSGRSDSVGPGQSVQFTVLVTPPPLSSYASLFEAQNGNMTELRVIVVGDGEFTQQNVSVECSVMISSECLRTAPTIVMADTGVSFYVRTTVNSPIRVTNMDSLSCPPFSVWFDLVPETTGFLQHAIYPYRKTLNPGEVFDFTIAVTTPDTGRGPHGTSRLSTLVRTHSDHPLLSLKNITQNTWTVPVSCFPKSPSMAFSCPSHTQLIASLHTVKVECSVGWRNNDVYLCPPTNFNFTINATKWADGLLPTRYLDGTDLLVDTKFNIKPERRFMPGETYFASVFLYLNMTGIYTELEQDNSTFSAVAIALDSIVQDVEGEENHFGRMGSGTLLFGRCHYESEPNISLSEHTGPYYWKYPDSIDANDTNPVSFSAQSDEKMPEDFHIDSPDNDDSNHSTSPFETPQNISEDAIAVIDMPHGVSRVVNWTITNPCSDFCGKAIFTILVDPETVNSLNQYGIKHSLQHLYSTPGATGDVSLVISTPSAPSLIPTQSLNLTIQAKYWYNLTTLHYTEFQTVLLNATGRCIIKQSTLSSASIALAQTSQPATYPTKFKFALGEPIQFSTILNLTNLDSPGCGDQFYSVPTLFNLAIQRSWSGSRRPLRTIYFPVDVDGNRLDNGTVTAVGPFSIEPGQWQLFNFTFNVPAASFPPKTYNIEVFVGTTGRDEHATSRKLEFEILSENPRPAWDLHAIELKAALGISIGFDIQWRACERPLDCSCPCQYHVFVNGEFETTLNKTYFPYRYSMSQAGVKTSVSVIVEDKIGRKSSSNACESMISFVPTDSAFSHLFILIVLVVVMAFPGLIFILEWLRHHDRLPLSSLHFESDDEGEDEEMAISVEMDVLNENRHSDS